MLRNPACRTVIRYVPTGICGSTYWPWLPVWVLFGSFVFSFTAVTSAFGTRAPLESRTSPTISPVGLWAKIIPPSTASNRLTNGRIVTSMMFFRFRILEFPQMCQVYIGDLQFVVGQADS